MKTPTFVPDTWVRANWDSFLALTNDPALEKAKCYYNYGWLRIEMSPVGSAHAADNHLIAQIVGLYAYTHAIALKGYVNPSLRKVGLQEAQPDLAYYLTDQSPLPGRGNSPIDLQTTAAPVLVIGVSATTLNDDLTAKRELYSQLGVREYWVIDTAGGQVSIFVAEANVEGLQVQDESRILPGLTTELLVEALRLGIFEGDTAVIRFILEGNRC
jgi:Uma2 family endonuclease